MKALPRIPQMNTDLFLRTTHPLICKQLLPKQQKICENPCNLWENKKIIRMVNSCHSSYYFPLVSGSVGQDSLYSFNSCSKEHYPHGKSVFIREIRGRIK